jgi:hypothetical protein
MLDVRINKMNIFLNDHDKDQLIAYAIELGYTSDRIRFYSDIHELRSVAKEKGLTEKETLNYKDRTLGLHIQADDLPTGNDVYFCIRDNHTTTDYSFATGRLDEENIQLPEFLARNIRSIALPVFILYHEIAHHVLGHVKPENQNDAERDADQWAVNQLNKKFESVGR